ncbi:SemiSWEET transporter [Xylophilus rhododendri]|nr:SemiSWEET transporter [Xylophilus rhododendri]
MDWTQGMGMAAGVLTSCSMLPQLFKVIRDKQAEEVSVVMIVVLIAGLALWVAYGIARGDWPVILTNSFSVIVNCLLLGFRIRYSGTK